MIKYTQRFNNGQLYYIARLNGVEVALIWECNTFISRFNVQKTGSTTVHDFRSVDAAKNFIETFTQIRLNK